MTTIADVKSIIRPLVSKEFLRGVEIFKHLSDAVLVDLASRMTSKKWGAGALIAGQHEEARAIFIVVDGKAKSVLFGENGREITLATLEPHDFYGETSLIDGKPLHSNLIAVEDTTLLVLDRSAFMTHLQKHPETVFRLLQAIVARLRHANELVGSLALEDVNARLIKTLFALAQEHGEPHNRGIIIRSRPTQQDLANMVGTCRETVSRTLSSMAKKGLVVSRGRSLFLSDLFFNTIQQAA